MPELPEVETIRRQLEPELVGRRVIATGAHPSAKFHEANEIEGAAFAGLERRGKYLIAPLDDDRELVIHLGMTGQVLTSPELPSGHDPDAVGDQYTRAWWQLDDRTMVLFRDVRRFGRIRVVDAGDYRSIATLAAIGPEPFDKAFTPDHLHAACKASSRRLKTQLLSQRPVAGLGNIYADEALWAAKVHPGARGLSRPAATRLHASIIEVLEAALGNGGTTLRDYRNARGDQGTNQFHLQCYGRGGEPCVRCGSPLSSKQLDGRTTTWCRSCTPR